MAKGIPRVRKLVSHVLQVVVAHIIKAQDKTLLEFGRCLADVLEELVLLLARLLGHLREVHHLGTL